jgi:hypothetical protein
MIAIAACETQTGNEIDPQELKLDHPSRCGDVAGAANDGLAAVIPLASQSRG